MTVLGKSDLAIIKAVLSKSSLDTDQLIADLEDNRLSLEDADKFRSLLSDEFMMNGIYPTFEPTNYGRQIEALIDKIGRSTLQETSNGV